MKFCLNKVFSICLIVLIILCIFFVFQGNLKKSSHETAKKAEQEIVTTNFPCYDFIRSVYDQPDSIRMLIKPGMEVHSYDPSPQDILAISKCKLFVYIGGESDQWVSKILDSINTDNITVLRLIDIVENDENLIECHHEENALCHQHQHHHHHQQEEVASHHHETDEHIWTSPTIAIKMIDSIAKTLASIYPEKADIFYNNAKDYSSKIEKIRSEINLTVENASEKFIVMGDRFPLFYFAKEFGIDYLAAFSGCSTAVEASPATIAKLIETVKEKNLKTVFHIELSNEKIANVVAEQCNVGTTLLHAAHNITKDEFESGITYVDIMEGNSKRLAEVLK